MAARAPLTAKRPFVVVTETGARQPTIRHGRFSVDRAVADDDRLRERAIKRAIELFVGQMKAEGWDFLSVELDPVTGTPKCQILPHVEAADGSYVDPGLPTIPEPPRGSDVSAERIRNYQIACTDVERAQKAAAARDYAHDVRDLVDIRVFVRFLAPPPTIRRAPPISLLGKKR